MTTSKKKCGVFTQRLCLMPADPRISKNGMVMDSMAIVPELAKKIEPVGEAYAKL